MVLQKGIPKDQSAEFVLTNPSSFRNLRGLLEKRVKYLFDVEIYLVPCGVQQDVLLELEVDPDVRIGIVGGEAVLDRAKEYIIGVCCPEIRYRVDFPICDLLEENRTVNAVDNIERETSAYLLITEEGFLEICGSKMAVALATSLLEQQSAFEGLQTADQSCEESLNQVCNDVSKQESTDLKTCEVKKDPKYEKVETDFPVWKKRELPKTNHLKLSDSTRAAKEFDLEENTVCDNETRTEPYTKQVKDTEKQLEDKKNDISENECVVEDKTKDSGEDHELLPQSSTMPMESEVRGLDEITPITGESLRDFALKLRYSDAEVSSALSKLGPEADKNSLLLELVKTQASAKELEDGSSIILDRDPRMVTSSPQVVDPSCLRPIVIDGSNVAMSHGNQQVFSCRGIGIAVDWFLQRGHRDIKVFVPSWRKEVSRPESPIINQEVLTRLEQDNILVWTPSRRINGRRVVCYDDRYIVRLAFDTDGVIVSNDNFRDLQNECPEWKKVVEQRLLMFSFVNDRFMPPDDPAGRHGPTLDEFLCKGCGKQCPYGRRCTYGNRCKYLHPERNSKSEAELQAMAPQIADRLTSSPPDIPYGKVNTERSAPGRPLPPPPDMPAYLLTKPLPPLPADVIRTKTKPLPLPPHEFHHNMTRIFPPTLRNSQSTNSQMARPASDPLPARDPYWDINTMSDHFNRIVSMSNLDGCAVGGIGLSRRGSVPQIVPNGSSYGEGFPSLPPSNGHTIYAPHPSMGCPPDMVTHSMVAPPVHTPNDGRPLSGEWIPKEAVYGACGFHPSYTGHFSPNQQTGYLPQHWGVTPPFSQPPHVPFNPHGPPFHYASNNRTSYHPQYPRTPYRGQCNSYYRTRGIPIDSEVSDSPDGAQGCSEELRITAYEKLMEVFPDAVEKILKVLDENPEETSVEKLTELFLDNTQETSE